MNIHRSCSHALATPSSQSPKNNNFPAFGFRCSRSNNVNFARSLGRGKLATSVVKYDSEGRVIVEEDLAYRRYVHPVLLACSFLNSILMPHIYTKTICLQHPREASFASSLECIFCVQKTRKLKLLFLPASPKSFFSEFFCAYL